jgi:hypothetical protein
MKTKKRFHQTAMALLAIITFALIACGDNAGETPTARSAGTEKPLSFGTNCKVTIKSDDKFTDAEWTAACNKVVDAIMRGYNKYASTGGLPDIGNKNIFENIFADNISVVLSSSATYNCEVKSGNYTTIYLKTSAVDTVDLEPAVLVLDVKSGTHTS